ncbi:MAG: oxygen-dependent coproporphyrinogen oxidase [Saprospiraceae bacterium]|nr:oxygen-dependent coproporphyrinogen oxidase [Saprospiraceae bacterium]
MHNKESIAGWMQGLQTRICNDLSIVDGHEFLSDAWDRPGGGGGISKTLEGKIIEKGGVGFSKVYGKLSKEAQKNLGVHNDQFFATGVSIVLHPYNPFVPIIHKNVRYFELGDGTWWFGGGIDLTPHYIVPEDARAFHVSLKSVCDDHEVADYEHYKRWADDYFFLPHRSESRGIGGIFFDRLQGEKEAVFGFVKDVGLSFAPIYTALMKKYHDAPFTDANKEWQYHRRSRYVEFNLVWDRGTKFGLQTNGRTESILMSMPPMAKWRYDYCPEKNTLEGETQALLGKKGIDWIHYG